MSFKLRLFLAVLVVIGAGVILVATRGLQAPGEQTVTIGGKQFTEQEIIGELMAALIESNSEIKVQRRLNLGGTMICFNALKAGDLDLYAEYTGTGLVNILKREAIADPEETYGVVKEAFKQQFDLVWLKPFGFNNTYTLTMRKDDAEKLNIRTTSDLANFVNRAELQDEPERLKAGFDAEFLTRPDGYLGLKKEYGFEFASQPRQMDPGLMYRAVADGAVDVIDGFATDGRIPAYDLQVLEDDKGFFPPYYAAPLVRAETLERFPQLEQVLNSLAGKLRDDVMQQLNYQVDEEGRKAADVAREFLVSEGLIQDLAAE